MNFKTLLEKYKSITNVYDAIQGMEYIEQFKLFECINMQEYMIYITNRDNEYIKYIINNKGYSWYSSIKEAA